MPVEQEKNKRFPFEKGLMLVLRENWCQLVRLKRYVQKQKCHFET